MKWIMLISKSVMYKVEQKLIIYILKLNKNYEKFGLHVLAIYWFNNKIEHSNSKLHAMSLTTFLFLITYIFRFRENINLNVYLIFSLPKL